MKAIIIAYLVYSTVTNWTVTFVGTNRLEIGEVCEVERIEIPSVSTNILRTRSLEVFLARRATNAWWRSFVDTDPTVGVTNVFFTNTWFGSPLVWTNIKFYTNQ